MLAAPEGRAREPPDKSPIIALGRRPDAMARAVNRLLQMKGGVVLVDGDRVAFELPLPAGGVMEAMTLTDLAERERELRSLLVARGYRFHDPLFTFHFMVADFLPSVRSPRAASGT